MTSKLWGGRFAEKTDRNVEAFTSSIHFDRLLYFYDIQGSIAHCKMLARQKIISDEEASTLIAGLKRVFRNIERGEYEYDDSLEDIHMHVETWLMREVGKTAQKLHTARSRNDQVALDIRMYLRHESVQVIRLLLQLRRVLVDTAKKHINVVLPGYTHLQRAQPVLFSHHLMAYYEMFSRDAQRFFEGLKRINVMPLGSAALAGSTFPIDRRYTAELLNFPEVSHNSIDSVSDRDFVIEFLSNASICMMHFSRFSEELILWSSSEFGFIELSDAFTTGSSIMPQKKNPDVAELVRGKTGRVYGDLMAMLTLMKSLPLAYNRDMQEDKEPLFDAVSTLKACIEIYAKMIPSMKVNAEVMRKSTLSGFLNATDLADYLAEKGMPFRQAHGVAGKAVQHALKQGMELHDLSLAKLKSFSSLIDEDIFNFLTVEKMIERRKSYGGTSGDLVKKAVKIAEKRLDKEKLELNEVFPGADG
jgi:argininosuccinate lyase